jgi:dihydrodipicolinate synthase/N-acetylneuraminate lyase
VYIYNFPALTGRSIPPSLVARLAAAYPNVAGLKDTIDSIAHIQETLALVRPERPAFSVLAGMEYHLLNTILLGGNGCVPGTANFAPQLLVGLYADASTGRLEAAAERTRALAPFARLFGLDAAPFVIVKEAMAAVGLIPRVTTRPPALPLPEDHRERLRAELEGAGVALS